MKVLARCFCVGLVFAYSSISVALGGDDKKPKDKPYPLDTCIVSGEKLGEMGEPFVTSYKGQQIKMCCKSCNKDFAKDPEKFLKKLSNGPKTGK
jgi:YHS domain-containing protein